MVNEDVTVMFENCETITLSGDSISVLWFGGVTEDVSYTAKGPQVMRVAKGLYLCVENPSIEFIARCKQWKDIAQIIVGEETYMIYWPYNHEHENPNQDNEYHTSRMVVRVWESREKE